MKISYKILGLILLCFNCQTIAQPYINFKITTFDSVYRNDIGSIEQFQHLGRYNLSTKDVEEYFTNYIVGFIGIVWDPSESYAIINFEEKENLIFDLKSNQIIDDQILDWHNLVEVLYSPTYNKLYVFSEDYIKELPITISAYDLNTKRIIKTTGVSAYASYTNYICKPKRNLFFSNDGKYIYISTNDTTTFARQLWTYSLESDSIISKRNLSEFGYPNMFGYSMSFGNNGKGVICSYNGYNEPTRQLYYNVFDFDNNRSTVFIHKNTVDNEYYLSNNGKYLLFISSFGDSSIPEHHTGFTEIYDVESGQLLKSFNLPPNGIVYTFDNYPNNIYYVKDIEKPTRQVYVLKMDSILNEIDLESLEPDTVNINSPTFTLTIKGIGFDSVSTVYFSGQEKITTFISDSMLRAEIPASDITAAGSYPVWVTDKWGVSDTLYFVVKEIIPSQFELNEITPAMSMKNQPGAFTMELTGSGFSSSSVVYFNGQARATTYVSDNTLNAAILDSDVSAAGNFPVWVSDGTTNSDTLVYKVVNNLPNQIIPIMNCVTNNGNGTYTAYFGYNNKNDVSVFVPVYSQNKISPDPWDRGQPGVFKVGVQERVFSVTWSSGNIIWHLNNKIATAKTSSPPCN